MDPLDDMIGDAFRALDAAPGTPRDYFDELPGRIEQRLAAEKDSTTTMQASTESHDENSGLHDIKALAQTTRQRISRRQTSQHDIEDAMLSSSHSGLHAVALPDPAKIISLPTTEEARALAASASHAAVDDDGRPVRAAAAMPRGPRGQRRGAMWMWAGGGLAAAAAVVLGVTMLGGGSSSEPKSSAAAPSRDQGVLAAGGKAEAAPPTPMAAGSGSASGSGSAMAAEAPRMAASDVTVQPITTAGIAEGSGSAAPTGAAGAASAVAANGAAADVAGGTDDSDREDTQDSHHAQHGGAAKGGEGDHAESAKGSDKAKKTGDAGEKGKPVASGGAGAGAGSKKAHGDLDGAVLGAGDKDELGIGAVMDNGGSKKKDNAPTRTELADKDMRAGLAAIEGKAKSCYGKYEVTGTAKVKLTIEPSGKVGKATASGDFAGTPTGTCVEAAVRSATFPAWTGGPTSTMFVVLLSD